MSPVNPVNRLILPLCLLACAVFPTARSRAADETDSRLLQPMDLELKVGDLRDFTELLTQKTGVKFFAAPEFRDYGLTVLENGQSAEAVMGQVAKLFHLHWARHGTEGAYTYEITQSAQERQEAEQQEGQSRQAMFQSLIQQAQPYLEALKMPVEEADARAKALLAQVDAASDNATKSKLVDEAGIYQAASGKIGEYRFDLQLWALMTPADFDRLGQGDEVVFRFKGDGGESTLPASIAEKWLESVRDQGYQAFLKDVPLDHLRLQVHFALDISSPDSLSVQAYWAAEDVTKPGYQGWFTMNTGLPLVARAARTEGESSVPTSDKEDSTLSSPVTLKPVLGDAAPPKPGLAKEAADENQSSLITSPDFFMELHQKTGKAVVADYFNRAYSRSSLTFEAVPLLDALNHSAEVLKSSWEKEGVFLRFTRADSALAREKDVPYRLIRKWRNDQRQTGYLKLDSLAEMAALPDSLLDNASDLMLFLDQICGMGEDWIATLAPQMGLKLYGLLNVPERTQAQSPGGFSFASLTSDRLSQALGLLAQNHADKSIWRADGMKREVIFVLKQGGPGERIDVPPQAQLLASRFYIRQREPDMYEWHDMGDANPATRFPIHAHVREKTREKAEAAVEAYLKAKDEDADQIQQQKQGLHGPKIGLGGSGVMYRIEIAGRLILQDEGAGSEIRPPSPPPPGT